MKTWHVTVTIEIGELAIEARYAVEARDWFSARREAIERIRRALRGVRVPGADSSRWDVQGALP